VEVTTVADPVISSPIYNKINKASFGKPAKKKRYTSLKFNTDLIKSGGQSVVHEVNPSQDIICSPQETYGSEISDSEGEPRPRDTHLTVLLKIGYDDVDSKILTSFGCGPTKVVTQVLELAKIRTKASEAEVENRRQLISPSMMKIEEEWIE